MACSCTTGLGNTGLPSCLPTNEIPVGLLFQKTYDSTGTRNVLLGSSIGTADYLNGLTQNADKDIRLYPVQDVAEAVSERGDSTYYTDSLGVNHFIKEGERGFVGEKVSNSAPKLVGKVGEMKCNQMSVYIIGNEGGIFGISTTEGQLQGFEIVKGSMDMRWVMSTAAKPAHMPMNFTMADTVVDSDIMKFDAGEITDTAKSLEGLLDIDAEVSGTVTVATFTAVLKLQYGSAKALLPVTPLVVADFVFTEISPTPGVTTLTSVSQAVDGTYVFLVTTTSADVNELTLSATGIAKGYEMSALTVTTP